MDLFKGQLVLIITADIIVNVNVMKLKFKINRNSSRT